MEQALDELSEKEKQTLRLIVRGHDAKSLAAELDLSVHTINERLRVARRKLGVTSSREAARLLFESEGGTYENLVNNDFGDAAQSDRTQPSVGPTQGHRARYGLAGILAGAIAMQTMIAAIAFATSPIGPLQKAPPEEVLAADHVVENIAREWLVLIDAGHFEGAFEVAGEFFRDGSSLAGWTASVSDKRKALGSVLDRELMEVVHVEEDGSDYCGVIFYTSFANGGTIAELVTLKKEPSGWSVHAYLVD